ncbi:PD-(D/E)XK nuclease family protein [Ruminococcus sp.]|uniref:PD-(D/E)XK nuclease family protein n=1 Tax=Ruminococcus sp. TaxID=41978 RepID=UPI002E802276|nr:PD-(D/E)XK nuclease family protein [Ruminococcus sp.]MEE3491911.1 PD-(D/E)XK nuclease family protein [Ruminococcus sp.]
MLRFVLGRSGYGKSEYLRRKFADLARKGEDKLLFLVPDQISFETEAAFLDLLGPAVSCNIMVLGFSRLCDYVFEQTGNRFATFADDGVRHLMMSLALEQVGDELTVFDKRTDSADMRELMLSAVKEYKKCALSSDVLREAAQSAGDDTLCAKLNDTALVYDAYNAIMERSYMDPLDSLTKVCELLTERKLFEGYTVALDSFYGFTAQEYDVIEQLLVMSSEMFVALTDDCRPDSENLFFVPRRTRARLSRMARDHGVEIAPLTTLHTPYRFHDEALIALEENAYRPEKEPYSQNADAVTVYRASGLYDECDFVARTIRALVEDGARYRDIAVICRSADHYTGILESYFDKYGVRCFMDKPQNIDAMPMVRLVTAAFNIVNRGFQREDVLSLLKTGLCSYSVGEIADFENYLFVWDISGRKFDTPFTAPPDGFADEMNARQKEILERVEALRADIIGTLRDFAFAVKDTDGRTIAKALMKLLYKLRVDDNINTLCDAYEAQGEHELAADLIRMWNVLCGILDKTVAVIGDYAMSPKRFAELLYTNFAASEVSTIPRGMDEVDVSTADRSLISDKKIVFLIGALDGEFPHTPVEAGVFTDDERVLLKETLHLPLSDSIEELIATERYYAYSALTAAGERLYLSFPAADMRGELLTPSDIISEVEVSLPKHRFINYDTVPIGERLRSKRAAFDYLVSRYHSRSAEIAALKAYFGEDEEYRAVINSIEDVLSKRVRKIKDMELTKELFGKEMRLSSTKIDVYHKCPFRYFCEYGLHIRERRKATVDALEYGTLMHHIFEVFFSRYSREEYIQMDESAIEVIVSDILDNYIDVHFGGTEEKSERFLYLLYRTKSTATRLLLHMIRELGQSDFIPVDFELGVGEDIPDYSVELKDGLRLSVRGSVDRVDRCDADGKSYIRVIDYKTGTKEFNINDLLYGLNLQMFIYLYAIRENGAQRYGEITPAGVLYMPAVSPSVSADPDTPEAKIRSELIKKYAMKGVILDDADVVAHMEHDGEGVFIPAKLKDGVVSASAGSLATLEELGAIFRRIDELTTAMAQSLYDGDVAALPLKGKKYDGCAYCVYRAVCLHKDDDPCREAVDRSAAEVFEELRGEGDHDGT